MSFLGSNDSVGETLTWLNAIQWRALCAHLLLSRFLWIYPLTDFVNLWWHICYDLQWNRLKKFPELNSIIVSRTEETLKDLLVEIMAYGLNGVKPLDWEALASFDGKILDFSEALDRVNSELLGRDFGAKYKKKYNAASISYKSIKKEFPKEEASSKRFDKLSNSVKIIMDRLSKVVKTLTLSDDEKKIFKKEEFLWGVSAPLMLGFPLFRLADIANLATADIMSFFGSDDSVDETLIWLGKCKEEELLERCGFGKDYYQQIKDDKERNRRYKIFLGMGLGQ